MFISHSRTVRSALPLATVCPSGLNPIAWTVSVWPARGWPSGIGRVGSMTFHSRTVWSALPVAKCAHQDRTPPRRRNRRGRSGVGPGVSPSVSTTSNRCGDLFSSHHATSDSPTLTVLRWARPSAPATPTRPTPSRWRTTGLGWRPNLWYPGRPSGPAVDTRVSRTSPTRSVQRARGRHPACGCKR